MQNKVEKKTKGQLTRERILTEALILYSEKGVQNVPFQDIAGKLGMTQPALYKYFSNRDELLKEAILYAAIKGREFFALKPTEEKKLNSKEKFHHYIHKNLEWAGYGKPFNIAFLSVHYFATQIEQIGEAHRIIQQARADRMHELLIAVKEDQFYSIKNLESSIISLHNYLLGEMMEAYNRPRSESKADRSARVIRNIEAFLS